MTLQDLYRSSRETVRARYGADAEAAAERYRRYVDFVLSNLPAGSSSGPPSQIRRFKILDAGCGNGWSTLLLRNAGQDARGLDLHDHALEAAQLDPDLPYTRGDVQELPFEASSFDVVGLHQVLEHIPAPTRALEEAFRVLRPGGRLIVVGPNLLSFGLNLYWSARHTARVFASGRVWESRTPAMPRHPGGNTMPEAWFYSFHHLNHTVRKLLGERPPKFHMRTPDERPPFHADNDACYYCNPMDLVNWARARPAKDAKLVRWWSGDRWLRRLLWPVAGGTWVVIEKTPRPPETSR